MEDAGILAGLRVEVDRAALGFGVYPVRLLGPRFPCRMEVRPSRHRRRRETARHLEDPKASVGSFPFS